MMASQMQSQIVPQQSLQIVPAIGQQAMYTYALANGGQMQPAAYVPHANSVMIGPGPSYVAPNSYHGNSAASMVHQV